MFSCHEIRPSLALLEIIFEALQLEAPELFRSRFAWFKYPQIPGIQPNQGLSSVQIRFAHGSVIPGLVKF